MLNKVILMGRLCADPDFRQTQSGIAVCRIRVAIDRPYTSKSTGERQADFINVVCWRQQAEFVSRYFHKGSMIIVEGKNMKKCPNCGRILHDDSIFCFGCMSEINKRQEIVLATPKKVFLKAKITTPIIAVALVSATVFGVYTYNNNSDKTTAVKKSTPQSAATVTTNTPVTTTLPPVTTVMTTTTKKREPDKAALASDIAEGAAL